MNDRDKKVLMDNGGEKITCAFGMNFGLNYDRGLRKQQLQPIDLNRPGEKSPHKC